MTKPRWTPSDMPDLHGRLAVVTGANAGLGLETTRELARRGAHVLLACRSRDKTEQAIAELRRSVPGIAEGQLEFRPLDLASLASIRSFAEGLAADHRQLDLLINNAGVMLMPYGETADGFETHIGTNHLGHFALTGRLLPLLFAAPRSRVVNLSSVMHRVGRITPDDLNRKRRFSAWTAYGRSKLANLLFTYELQRRLGAARAPTIAVAAHPGWAGTDLLRVGARVRGWGVADRLAAFGNRYVAQSPAMGALPSLYAATMDGLQGGEYIGPNGWLRLSGWPRVVSSNSASHDRAAAAGLWARSVELTAVDFAALDS